MLFKVVIIDDEYMTREGLKTFIDWNEEGFEVVGEASDGMEGIEVVVSNDADLAICDIKMSKMNGIDMAFEIKSALPKCKIIFVSGYSNKENLKSAIRLNAEDFLDKPIDRIEFLTSIRSIHELLIKEALSNENYGEITQSLLTSNQIIINSLIQRLISKNEVNLSHVKELMEYLKLNIDGEESYRVLLMSSDTPLDQKTLDSIKMEEQKFLVTSLQGESEDFGVFVFYGNTKEDDIQEYAKYIISNATIRPLRIAIGKEVHGMDNINSSYESAKDAMNVIYKSTISKVQLSDKSTIPSIIRSIKNYIYDNYEGNLSINTIAEEVHLSPQYLCKVFKEETSLTVNTYITQVRMERAQELLLNHEYKLYEIADMVGYHDANYFTRVYKKTFGESPSDFRDRNHV